jgi:hypothetical protein
MRTVASCNRSRCRLGLNSAFQIASSTVTSVISAGIGPVLRIVSLNSPGFSSTRRMLICSIGGTGRSTSWLPPWKNHQINPASSTSGEIALSTTSDLESLKEMGAVVSMTANLSR